MSLIPGCNGEACVRQRTFADLDLSRQTLDGYEFEDCLFRSCNLSAATLKGCRFIDCRLENCDLTAAKLPGARLRGTAFKECRAGGVDWAAASQADDLSFEHCVLDHASFVAAKPRRLSIVDSRAREADFSDADLRGAVFAKSDLLGSRFGGADLSGADLRGATHYLIDARETKIRKALVSLPEAVGLLAGLDVVVEGEF